MRQAISHGSQYDRSQTVVETVSRQEFVQEVWDYRDGQDVSLIGPSGRGKTTLTLQLLRQSISPKRKCVVLAGKPPKRDPVMGKAAERLNLRIVEEWPPAPNIRDRNRNGWVLRPYHTMSNPVEDNKNLHTQFRKAIIWAYQQTKQPTILVIDERYHVEVELKVTREEMDASLLRGQPHSGQWNLLQRSRWVSYNVYSAPEHIFIFYDPTEIEQKRYAEIGGVDPYLIREVTPNLRTQLTPSGQTISQVLYIRRSSQEMYVVDV